MSVTVASTSGRCELRPSLSLGVNRLAPLQPTARHRRRKTAVAPLAAIGSSKSYNKCKSRQDLEQDYYKEWAETTKMTEEEKQRPVTALTLLTFLPTWFKFYVVPGPIRFLWFFIWTAMKKGGYQLRKKAVIAGVKLDARTLQRRNSAAGYRLRETALRRLHGKESILAPLQLMVKG